MPVASWSALSLPYWGTKEIGASINGEAIGDSPTSAIENLSQEGLCCLLFYPRRAGRLA